MPPTARRTLGWSGEAHARRFLEAHGYVFVTANWRCPVGELDLVMRDGEELVFVEVKTRHGERAGRAEEGVSRSQVRRLLLAAESYVAERADLADPVWRVDLVAITLDGVGRVRRLTHVPNALGDW